MKLSSENPLMIIGIRDVIQEKNEEKEWFIRKDRYGVNMAFYKDLSVDEIIYCLGEISLATTTGLHNLQEEYYDSGDGDVFNMAMKLLRDNSFAKEFYLKYELLKEKL